MPIEPFVVSAVDSGATTGEAYLSWENAISAAKQIASKHYSCLCPIWRDNTIVGLVTDDGDGLIIRDFRPQAPSTVRMVCLNSLDLIK